MTPFQKPQIHLVDEQQELEDLEKQAQSAPLVRTALHASAALQNQFLSALGILRGMERAIREKDFALAEELAQSAVFLEVENDLAGIDTQGALASLGADGLVDHHLLYRIYGKRRVQHIAAMLRKR